MKKNEVTHHLFPKSLGKYLNRIVIVQFTFPFIQSIDFIQFENVGDVLKSPLYSEYIVAIFKVRKK